LIDIAVQNVVKAFEEGNNILDGLTFDVNEGERVGLLGRNGAGKSTLFRLISGELEPDEGNISVHASKTLGVLSQIPKYPPGTTTEDVLHAGQSRLREVRSRMEALERTMATGGADSVALADYDALAGELERLGGYGAGFEIDRVANALSITEKMRAQPFSELSGGEMTRVNLARMILENTDVLLLDEPTNHLDTRAVEWLEEFLGKFRGTVLAVSHDRYFLDRTVTRIVEIEDGKAVFFSGNYTFYATEKRRRREELMTRYEREQAEARRLQASADRLKQWGVGNRRLMKKAFAIEKRIERVTTTERPRSDKRMGARFDELDFKGDEAISLKAVSKSYGGKALFEGVDLVVTGGERIAVVGDNGAGKSTLIRIIIGEEPPDSGRARLGPSVKAAYLPQQVRFDSPFRSALDTLMYETGCSAQTARNRLGAFKFSGDDVYKLVGDMSGGEQSRLRLCSLMSGDVNLLILDEPTNHLDIPSREWMEDAIGGYEGVLLFVSHDRYFIEKFAERVWELRDGVLRDFPLPYAEYILRREQAAPPSTPAPPPAQAPRKPPRPPRDSPRNTARRIERAERDIERTEALLAQLTAAKEQHSSDYKKLMELEQEEAPLQALLEEQYHILENLLG
jgi:ATPase subunit of ABC transporter with duplicated ATPase domains